MLRALIGAHPRIAAISYDINYVWKYRNYRVAHDELTPADLTPAIERYIHRFFRRWRHSDPSLRVAEKSVCNTLRVPFVRAVFPDCQFVHLIRDGRDVAASAKRQWQAPLDWRATLKKVRRFPWRAVPSYGLDYAKSYVARLGRANQRVESWGPRFCGIDEVAQAHPLLVTCGIQWRRSIEATQQGLAGIDDTDLLELRYERLVSQPQSEATRLMDFLGLDFHPQVEGHVARTITKANIGKWRTEIDEAERAPLMEEIGATLTELGYGS